MFYSIRQFLPALLLGSILVGGFPISANATLLVHATFTDPNDPTQGSLANSGSLGGNFSVNNPPFVYSADLPPTVEQGLSGDFGGDLTAPNRKTLLQSNNSALNDLTSFTISGWINGIPGAAFIADKRTGNITTGFGLQAITASNQNRLRLFVNGGNVQSDNDLPLSGWGFFAVTYDGTLTSNNVNFYFGDGTTLTQSGGTQTMNQGTTISNTLDLAFGRSLAAGTTPALELMNDFRFYGVQSGSGGVLSEQELFAVMIPEPGSALLLALSGGLLVLRRALGGKKSLS